MDCCVKNCHFKSLRGMTFHKFPSDENERRQLLIALNSPSFDPPADCLLCRVHFFTRAKVEPPKPSVLIKKEPPPASAPEGLEEPPPGPAPKGFKLQGITTFDTSNVEVCRICLATDSKMFSLDHGMLKFCMESLNLNDHCNKKLLPKFACWECGSHLLKYYRLVEKSLIAQATLLEIFADHGQITKDLVRHVKKKQLNLQSSLGYPESAPVIICMSKDSDINRTKKILGVQKKPRVLQKSVSKIISHGSDDSSEDIQNTEYFKEYLELNMENSFEDLEKSESDKCKNENLEIHYENVEVLDPEFDYHAENFESTSEFIDQKGVKQDENEFYDEIEMLDSDIENDGTLNIVSAFKAESEKPEETENNDQITSKAHEETSGDENNLSEEPNYITENITEYDKQSPTCEEDSHAENVLGSEISPICLNMSESEKQQRHKYQFLKEPEEFALNAINNLKYFTISNLTLREQMYHWTKEALQPPWWNGEVFKCEVCSKKFNKKKSLDKHLQHHKKNRGKYMCSICEVRFQNMKRLKAHSLRMHSKKYECNFCSKVLFQLKTAKRHEEKHSGNLYQCPLCPYISRNRSQAWEHARTAHGQHHCARCGHVFTSAKGLRLHNNLTHAGLTDESEKKFPCEECDVSFSTVEALRVHLLQASKHKNQKGSLAHPDLKTTCKECGNVFESKSEMLKHSYTEHKPYHVKNIYPRTCRHCDVILNSSHQFNTHMTRAHPEVRNQPIISSDNLRVVCDKCGRMFASTTGLRRHEQDGSCGAERRFACEECGRKYASHAALQAHAPAHAAGPHQCSQCGVLIKYFRNLKKHMRIHTGETPYMCSQCGKKFTHKACLTQHMKHTHLKVPWPARVRKPRPKISDAVTDTE